MNTVPLVDFLLFLEVLKDKGEGIMKIGTRLEIQTASNVTVRHFFHYPGNVTRQKQNKIKSKELPDDLARSSILFSSFLDFSLFIQVYIKTFGNTINN